MKVALSSSRKKLEVVAGFVGVVLGFEIFRAALGDAILIAFPNLLIGIIAWGAFLGVMLLSGYVAARLVRRFCPDETMPAVDLIFLAGWWLFCAVLVLMAIGSIYRVITLHDFSFLAYAFFLSILLIVLLPAEVHLNPGTLRAASVLAVALSTGLCLWSKQYDGLMGAAGIVLILFWSKTVRATH